MEGRRKFSEEFKREAVALAREGRGTAAQTARDLGIAPNLLYRWPREFERDGGRAFRGKGVARDEELARLKRELGRVTRERDFLREAAGYFAKTSK